MELCNFFDILTFSENERERDASMRICEKAFTFIGSLKFHEDLFLRIWCSLELEHR